MRVSREHIGWEDSALWVFDLQTSYHRRAELAAEPFRNKKGDPYWVFQLSTWSGYEQGRRIGLLQVEARWPNSTYISVAALVIGLVREMERKLELMETEARQRSFF